MTMQVAQRNSQSAGRAARLRFALQMAEQAQKVGDRIAYERTQREWSRPALARELPGVATGNDVYRWERGKHLPRADTMEALAALFGITVADLYAGPPSSSIQKRDLSDALNGAEGSQLNRIETKLDRVLGLLLEQETRGAAERERDEGETPRRDEETGS